MMIPHVILFICFALLVWYGIEKSDNFIDLKNIFIQYWVMLKHTKHKLVFCVLPFIMSTCLTSMHIADIKLINIIMVIISILIAILFSVLSIIYGMADKIKDKKVLKEICNVINLNAVLCVFDMCFGLGATFCKIEVLCYVFSVFIYYLFIMVLLNCLIIFKRLNKLISKSL